MLINNRYQVVRPLGEGGFGHAYLAEDTQMPSQRKCVIKQLKPITTSPEVYQVVQDRFQREAAILEQLGENHRQIPRLYAYFSENQQFYLVQEWIEGETLEDIAVPQPESAVLSLLTSLLPVLDFVHAQGIIHRDIKPENIILRSNSRQPVLIDFGAVRETMGTVMNSKNHPTSSIVIGTPGYMSAEQAIGRPIPSSDLYSLGLTAIFLLTGQVPQALTTDGATGEIIWQPSAQHVSVGLRAVLDRAVRSHPRDRYPNAAAMLSALKHLSENNSEIPTASDAAGAAAAPTVITPVPAVPPPITPPATPQNNPSQNNPVPNFQTQNSQPHDSQFRTMAVAPNTPASTASQSNPAAANTVVTRPSDQSQTSQVNKPWFTKTPLVVGLGLAVVTSGVAAAGLIANRNTNTLIQPLVSDSSINADSSISVDPSLEPDLSVEPPEAPEPPEQSPDEGTNEGVLVPSPKPIDDNISTWVALAGPSSQQIDIYEQPSFQSAAPHYGVGGDRVQTVGETYAQSSGPVWMRIQFPSSGVAGWVPQYQVAQNGISPVEPSPVEPPPVSPPPEEKPIDPPNLEPPSLEEVPKFTQLKGAPSERINVRSSPSTSASSPHYAVGGDPIQILDVARGADGYNWYEVAFESGAEGWVRSDLIDLP